MRSQREFWRVEELRNLELLRVRGANWDFPREMHDEYEITCIESGSARLRCRGRDFDLFSGSIVVIAPGEGHQFRAAAGHYYSFRTFFTAASSLCDAASTTLGSQPAAPDFPPVVEDKTLAQLLCGLHILLRESDSLLEQEQQAVIAGAELVQRHGRPACKTRSLKQERLRMEKVRAYLHDNYQSNISLGALAQMAGLSPFYFLRLFCRDLGMPPHAYLLQVRINQAKKMLLQGQPPVEVALSTGFADQSHFHRHFQRMAEMTPLEYRDAHRIRAC